jgi:hypothetical protein
MEIGKIVEQFLAEGTRDKNEVTKYFQLVFDRGFNAAVKQAHALAKDCYVPDTYSQPCVDDLALDIALLKREI